MPIPAMSSKSAAAGFRSRLKLIRCLPVPFICQDTEHEMRRQVVAVVHRDDNAEETGNLWHGFIIFPCPFYNEFVSLENDTLLVMQGISAPCLAWVGQTP